MMKSLPFDDLIVSLQSSRITSYVTVAAMVLYSYDYMLTLNIELSLIWGSRWSLVKVLFIVVRYTPFINIAFIIFYMTLDETSWKAWSVTFQICGWLFAVSVSAAEILLTIRTWACWERARKLTIGLPIFFVIWIPNYVCLGLYLRSPVLVQPAYYANSYGFVNSAAKPITAVYWVGMMVYDAGLLLLMCIRGFHTLKDMGNKTLSNVVYRDGIIYYLFLFVLSLVNVVVIRCLPYEYPNLFTTLEMVMYSTLTCRAILHIREQNNIETMSWSLDLISQPVVFN